MDHKSVSGNCRFEEITCSDLFVAIESIRCRKGTGCLVDHPYEDPDLLLTLAMKEIESARAASDASNRKRLCSNAILNARRSLACLVDWYVIRDLGHLCKNPPKNAEDKAAFLRERGIIDDLASRVLSRAIEKGNIEEQNHTTLDLDMAEDIVELLRRSIVRMRELSKTRIRSMDIWLLSRKNFF